MHQEHVERHKDGSIRAKGPTVAGKPDGYWEWFRLDGTKMRSGSFTKGAPSGTWTTYDDKGEVYKVTTKRHDPASEDQEWPIIGLPAMRGLRAAGIVRLEQVAGLTDEELLQLHGIGPKAVRLLREALSHDGNTNSH